MRNNGSKIIDGEPIPESFWLALHVGVQQMMHTSAKSVLIAYDPEDDEEDSGIIGTGMVIDRIKGESVDSLLSMSAIDRA